MSAFMALGWSALLATTKGWRLCSNTPPARKK